MCTQWMEWGEEKKIGWETTSNGWQKKRNFEEEFLRDIWKVNFLLDVKLERITVTQTTESVGKGKDEYRGEKEHFVQRSWSIFVRFECSPCCLRNGIKDCWKMDVEKSREWERHSYWQSKGKTEEKLQSIKMLKLNKERVERDGELLERGNDSKGGDLSLPLSPLLDHLEKMNLYFQEEIENKSSRITYTRMYMTQRKGKREREKMNASEGICHYNNIRAIIIAIIFSLQMNTLMNAFLLHNETYTVSAVWKKGRKQKGLQIDPLHLRNSASCIWSIMALQMLRFHYCPLLLGV